MLHNRDIEWTFCLPLMNRSRCKLGGRTRTFAPDCVVSIRDAAPDPERVEVIVVDFGSTDDPPAGWLPGAAGAMRTTLLHLVEPFCIGKAFNVGMAAASADGLAVAGAEFLFTRDAFARATEARANGAVFVPVTCFYTDPTHTKTERRHTSCGACFMTKDQWRAAGTYDEFHSHGLTDCFFFERLQRIAKIVRDEDTPPCVFHQWHPGDDAWLNRYHGEGWQIDKGAKEARWHLGNL